MTEILSHNEIDQLLNAINSGGTESERKSKIKIYDFKRPDKFTKEQIRTVSSLHEAFSRLATTLLSAELRTLVQVHVASVDQLTFEEFIRSIPNPTFIATLLMKPLKELAILEIDPAITFALIEGLLGGEGEKLRVNRDLTTIEFSLMEDLIYKLIGVLRESWSGVLDLQPRLSSIEANPQFAQIVPPTEMVLVVTLEVKLGEAVAMMNLCLPFLTIEPIIPRLSANFWYSASKPKPNPQITQLIRSQMEKRQVNVWGEFSPTSAGTSLKELIQKPMVFQQDSIATQVGYSSGGEL